VNTGVFVGTGMGGAQSTDEGYQTVYEERSDRVKPYSVLMAMNNAAAAWIGIDHHLLGPNLTYSCACSSSAVAIGEAWKRIATGELDVMIAGGSEAPLTFGTLKAWEALKTLALKIRMTHRRLASRLPESKRLCRKGAAMVVPNRGFARWARRRIHAEFAVTLRYVRNITATVTRPGDDWRAGKRYLRRRAGVRRAGPQRWRTMRRRLPRSTGLVPAYALPTARPIHARASVARWH
jgi:hypothetical protein